MDSEKTAEFGALCGTNNMKKLETFLLLKKAHSVNEEVEFSKILESIEKTTNDVKIDPYDVIKTIFVFYQEDHDQISINDLKEFFDHYRLYFTKEDVKEFISEAMNIQRDGALIAIQEIASMIRDDIECFPK
jgi:hypothetical protein